MVKWKLDHPAEIPDPETEHRKRPVLLQASVAARGWRPLTGSPPGFYFRSIAARSIRAGSKEQSGADALQRFLGAAVGVRNPPRVCQAGRRREPSAPGWHPFTWTVTWGSPSPEHYRCRALPSTANEVSAAASRPAARQHTAGLPRRCWRAVRQCSRLDGHPGAFPVGRDYRVRLVYHLPKNFYVSPDPVIPGMRTTPPSNKKKCLVQISSVQGANV